MKKGLNAQEVLFEVEAKIEHLERWQEEYKNGYTWRKPRFEIREVYKELSIFDWWNDYLSQTQLKDMRKFLKEAIKLGYTGYVCFKVGATGCANGMWAHKKESETGYSPDGECLYKSFTPSYNYWQVKTAEGNWIPSDDEYDSVKTIKQLEDLLK
jgi:hypothetical protein